MPLASGTRIGAYEVLAFLGAGGMGEVYRAHDPKLRREVAVKVLPASVTEDRERLARFQREARVLASLNHPGIGAIYELEESEGRMYLILELVEGETLDDRIARGPIPVKETLPLLHQLAEALEAAHGRGITHRDLKPPNIKITPEGRLKILDFGLAKSLVNRTTAIEASEHSTVTRENTSAVVLLGTVPYMSPEQARGKTVDSRTDIWAFGCVVYESLTARRPFQGETISDTLSAILEKEPDWDALPAETPENLRKLLRRCLAKDPRQRVQHIGDVRLEIEEATANPTIAAVSSQPPPRTMKRLIWFALGFGIALAISVSLVNRPENPESSPVVMRSEITLQPAVALFDDSHWGNIALSPDGATLVYAGELEPGKTQLQSRLVAGLDSRSLPGTEGGYAPFFSPDGEWIGFFSEGKLRKTRMDGLPPVTLCDAPEAAMGTWSTDGSITFSSLSGLWRLPVDVRVPELLAKPDPAEGSTLYTYPQTLPGGNSLLFTKFVRGTSEIAVLVSKTGDQRTLVEGARYANYLPTGHIVYHNADRKLVAIRFDVGTLSTQDSLVEVLDDAWVTRGFSFSRTGTLVYLKDLTKSSLIWLNREGKTERVKEIELSMPPRSSPRGERLAISMGASGWGWDIWVYQPSRDVLTRLTFGGANWSPVWSPDGERIAYVAQSAKGSTLLSVDANGTSEPETLFSSERLLNPSSWSSDGRLLWLEDYSEAQWDIWLLEVNAKGKPQPFLATAFNEFHPMISPDGSWLAYVSDESGANQVYIRAVSSSGGKWQISTSIGDDPVWNSNGKELFFRIGNRWMSVEVETQPEFRAGNPVLLFEGTYDQHYDVAPGGDQFILVESELTAAQSRIQIVTNWFEEIKRLAPSR